MPLGVGMLASKKDLGVALKQLLVVAERRGRLKRAALARTVGVSPSSLYAYLDGTTLPPADVLGRLLDVLDVDPAHRRHLTSARDTLDPRTGPTAQATTVPTPCQLPPDVFGFVGRDVEMARLDELISNCGRPALVIFALDGTAGVGKTALAVHWAHQVRDRFTDGQLYLNMRGYGSDSPLSALEALVRLLRALGTPTEQMPTDVDSATSWYRSLLTDRRILLVLDNVANAEQIRPLLPGGSGSAVVVTSRDQLGGLVARDGAQRLHLDVLPPRDANALLTQILGPARTETERDSVTELAELCAHLPLALRIAAANIAVRPNTTAAAYVAELRSGNRLDKLAVIGDPQTAVRHAFHLSYRSLEPTTRRLFRLLGLVPGREFTAEAAAALLDTTGEQAARTLEQLAAASLIQRHTTTGRYLFHDLIRLHAASLAETDSEHDVAWRRLCDWYLRTADAAVQFEYDSRIRLPRPAPHTDRFTDERQALEWLESERANMIALISRAADVGPTEYAWQLADAIRTYLYQRLHTSELRDAALLGLQAAQEAGELLAEGVMELMLANAMAMLGDPLGALSHEKIALARFTQQRFPLAEALILCNIGLSHHCLGESTTGAEYLRKGMARLRQLDMANLIAIAALNLCSMLLSLGRLDEALQVGNEGLAVDRKHRRHSTKMLLETRAAAYRLRGEYDLALTDITAAVAAYQETGTRYGGATIHAEAAHTHAVAGHRAEAMKHVQCALAQTGEITNMQECCLVLDSVGNTYQVCGQPRNALYYHREALRVAETKGYRKEQAMALVGSAEDHCDLADLSAAHALSTEALALAVDMGHRIVECRALIVLARISETRSELDDTGHNRKRAQQIQDETGYHPLSRR